MGIALIVVAVVAALLLAAALFFAKEILKKIGMIYDWGLFASANGKTWHYPGAKALGIKSGMYKLEIVSGPVRGIVSFMALLHLPLFGPRLDPFAVVDQQPGVIELYLGNGAFDILVLPSQSNVPLSIKFDPRPEHQETLKAVGRYAISKPHWWQKIGIFG